VGGGGSQVSWSIPTLLTLTKLRKRTSFSTIMVSAIPPSAPMVMKFRKPRPGDTTAAAAAVGRAL